jgi:redox-sensitive bicupin YhaK (pirin superfamily)
VYRVRLAAGKSTTHEVGTGRGAWLQLIKGSVSVNGTLLNPGDAVSTDDAGTLTLTASEDAEALLFDLA